MRWEVGGRIAAVLWGSDSIICSKQHVIFLCSTHLAFLQVFRSSPVGASIQLLQ